MILVSNCKQIFWHCGQRRAPDALENRQRVRQRVGFFFCPGQEDNLVLRHRRQYQPLQCFDTSEQEGIYFFERNVHRSLELSLRPCTWYSAILQLLSGILAGIACRYCTIWPIGFDTTVSFVAIGSRHTN